MTTSDQSQAAPTSPAPSPEPQDVRQALELQLFDLVELARDTRSDKGGEAKWVHPCGALVKEFAKRIAALAQSDAEPFPQPQRNDGGEPCGECHLQTGETCDICGALAQSDAEPIAYDRAWDAVMHDCRSDLTGLDDGPLLPGHGPRKKPAPKTREQMAVIRAKAWETRRARATDRSGE